MGLWIFLGILSVGVCCIAPLGLLGAGGLFAFQQVSDTITCSITFRFASKAMSAYVKDKGHLPDADKWQDEIAPYYDKVLQKRLQEKDMGPIKVHKSADVWMCSDKSVTGIAFNDELSGAKWDDVKNSGKILLFETEGASRNAHGKYVTRPKKTGPKIMNEHRSWMEMNVNGVMNTSSFETKMDDEDDSSAKPKADDTDKV